MSNVSNATAPVPTPVATASAVPQPLILNYYSVITTMSVILIAQGIYYNVNTIMVALFHFRKVWANIKRKRFVWLGIYCLPIFTFLSGFLMGLMTLLYLQSFNYNYFRASMYFQTTMFFCQSTFLFLLFVQVHTIFRSYSKMQQIEIFSSWELKAYIIYSLCAIFMYTGLSTLDQFTVIHSSFSGNFAGMYVMEAEMIILTLLYLRLLLKMYMIDAQTDTIAKFRSTCISSCCIIILSLALGSTLNLLGIIANHVGQQAQWAQYELLISVSLILVLMDKTVVAAYQVLFFSLASVQGTSSAVESYMKRTSMATTTGNSRPETSNSSKAHNSTNSTNSSSTSMV